MKINWKVRVKNPVFWRNIAISTIAPILMHMGVGWNEMTTWHELWTLIVNAVSSPVILVAVICSVWNAINDPTTVGDSDSERALTYTEPQK